MRLAPAVALGRARGLCHSAAASGSRPVRLSERQYDLVADDTLEHLCDRFDALPETCDKCGDAYDVSYSMGVLTVRLGGRLGTYVINKQTPNRQIWLSSPASGPKRYDLFDCGPAGYKWLYRHDGVSLHSLLTEEVRRLLDEHSVDFIALEKHIRV